MTVAPPAHPWGGNPEPDTPAKAGARVEGSRIKKNPDQGLGFMGRSHFNANMKSYNKKSVR